MATGAITAKGTTLRYNDIEISEVVNFGGPNSTRPQVDATHLKSDAREYLAGLADNGDFTFTVNYLPDDPGQIELQRALRDVETPAPFEVELQDAVETWMFDAVCTGFVLSGDVDAVMRADVTMRISGAFTKDPALPTEPPGGEV